MTALSAARFCTCHLFEGLCQNVQQLQPTHPPENIRCCEDGFGKVNESVPSFVSLGTGRVEFISAKAFLIVIRGQDALASLKTQPLNRPEKCVINKQTMV